MASGKAQIYGGSPQFWLWTALAIAVFAVIYWKFAQGALESQKSAVMAKQRAVMQTLGPKIVPFRNKVENWVLGLARASSVPTVVTSGVTVDAIANGPGVYLRLRRENAKDAKSLRAAAVKSLRDGFTSCLFVRKEEATGKPCKAPSDCDQGLLCNDLSVCARPSQPYNLRLAYRTLRILSSEWTDELHQATTDLKVRAFELDLDAVTHNDVPIAVEILSRARYFTAVLDDDPKDGLPPPLAHAPEEREETEEERVQRVPHTARVGIWDVRADRLLVELATQADGEFVAVGDRRAADERTIAAENRQVNSCAIALAVKEALATGNPEPSAPPVPARP
jgi:hypothetical protein